MAMLTVSTLGAYRNLCPYSKSWM